MQFNSTPSITVYWDGSVTALAIIKVSYASQLGELADGVERECRVHLQLRNSIQTALVNAL